MVKLMADRQLLMVFGGIIGLLVVATIIGQLLRLKKGDNATIANLNARIYAWWVMCAVFVLSLAIGPLGSIILFAFLSFGALREFITLTPTRPGDHGALFWIFFIALPWQYYLVYIKWYGLFSILIPVYAFLFVPSRIVLAGDPERFLERSAKIQWGLMICVYCVSHVPALLILEVAGFSGKNARLLLFLVVVVQLSDVFQYVWGKLLGRHKVAPVISPSKTWEGLVFGVLSATAVGALLTPITPFGLVKGTLLAFLIAVLGFFGGLTMSAIKRDRGVKDYGSSIAGHGGVLDRIDSLCFAGPVFFHLVRYFF